ncbi:uncharacterized protein TRUGW13939_02921 [Talaromyces rugulosus]|uniref:Uncharacterized protein n=1 Tax=Talaromyces rugulosus TaxID=121627 RepID=A0A7H8QRR6_TALRU|nr:uncharacterized protein TRUGW13939_02921 [Talaromyces rugulosus]QKX55823.1 hypothetical protein TRUGW13939_02921 [Talaromyces rugulosus]
MGSLDTHAELATNGNHSNYEPIAIIGMGCRLPGGATSTSKLWDLLLKGRSGYCQVPSSRFETSLFHHPDATNSVEENKTGGFFIQDDVRSFDNTFFGVNNMEATYMDPQQRQLLEVCFECFESAGETLEMLSGEDVGCYVANCIIDFLVMQFKDPQQFHRYSATGLGSNFLANRISHAYNLKGPSVVLDTACSSSLYALHSACSALHMGECKSAVVAGANFIQSPEFHLLMIKGGFISPTGTSHTFDTAADGYGRGEGVAALYIKRLSDAIRDGDHIRSIIRSTALNSNGHTDGIAYPSVSGQEAVIRKAYAMAGLPTTETDYIETHGTGTTVGDPVEVEALSRVFNHKTDSPISIGSVKPNLGHSEAASGLASIIKVTLALERNIIPPTIGIKHINPNLKLVERNFQVPTEPTSWPPTVIQRASVNSIGFGGANAHAIIDSARPYTSLSHNNSHPISPSRIGKYTLLTFSAHGKQSLMETVTSLGLIQLDRQAVLDLAFTLASHRSKLADRGYLLIENGDADHDLRPENLQMLDPNNRHIRLPIAFVFTGQGAQWPNMGRELFTSFPVYRRTIQCLDFHLKQLAHGPSWTIEESILEPASSSLMGKASRSQTVCTAIQIALVELLQDWNIVPEVVIGHSSGEICAAFAVGYLTAAEAIAIAYYRGMTVSKIEKEGSMAAVGLGRTESEQEIASLGLQGQIRVACVNSPRSSTISGDASAINSFTESLQNKDIFARKLKTDLKAYHSDHMQVVSQEYEDLVESVYSKRPTTAKSRCLNQKMFSTVTGGYPAAENLVDTPGYWRINLESPVLFSDGLQKLMENSYHLIEIGPHSALQQPINEVHESMDEGKGPYVYSPTIIRGKDAEQTMLRLCGQLYLHQQPVTLNKANRVCSMKDTHDGFTTRCKLIHDLPTYNWNHKGILYHESRVSSGYRQQKHGNHELLGSLVPGISEQSSQWRAVLNTKDVPWLDDHKLGSSTVFPGAGYLALATEALFQLQQSNRSGIQGVTFRQVHISNVLVLNEDTDVDLFTDLRPAQISSVSNSEKWWSFEISSVADNVSTIHANGQIAIRLENCFPSPKFEGLSVESMEEQATRTWYDRLTKEGLRFGLHFQSLSKIYNDGAKILSQTISETDLLPDGLRDQEPNYLIHPITLDALLQTSIIASAGGSVSRLKAKVPVSIGSVDIIMPSATDYQGPCTIYADSTNVGFGVVNVNAELRSSSETVLVRINDIRMVAYGESNVETGLFDEKRHPVLRVLWKPHITTLKPGSSAQLTSYIDRFAKSLDENPLCKINSDLGQFAGTIDLLSHSNPRLRILELGTGDIRYSALLLDLLRADSSLRHFRTYDKAELADDGRILGGKVQDISELEQWETQKSEIKSDAAFDALIIPPMTPGLKISDILTERTMRLLTPEATIVFVSSGSDEHTADMAKFSVVSTVPRESQGRHVAIARSIETVTRVHSQERQSVIIVERNNTHEINPILQNMLSEYFGQSIDRIDFEDLYASIIPTGCIIISTIELEQSVFETPNEDDIERIKAITNNASIIVWLTGGALFKAKNPSFGLTSGFARTLKLEQPSTNMFLIDFDMEIESLDTCAANTISVIHQGIHATKPEFEFLQHDGVLYSCRFVPDESMNERFRRGQNADTVAIPLNEAGHCQLDIQRPGQLDSLHFKQFISKDSQVAPGYVEVKVQAVGLNAKDMYALHRRVDTKESTCSLEFTGFVHRVSSSESQFKPGDRVVVMAPSHFGIFECVPEWACCLLLDDEDFEICSTIPVVFGTAIYALQQSAQLRPGESVLVHSATGGLGIAAIQIAKLIGAEIFATVGTQEKRDFLIKNFGIEEDHIFSSRDSTFLPGILKTTGGHGVDVVLNCLTGDLLHDSWSVCAEFGRFVEVGKYDIVSNGKLDMGIFARGTTFTAFDLSDMFWSKNEKHHNIWSSLLTKAMQYYRQGKIKAVNPLKVFDVSEVTQAFRYFSLGSRIGKVVVSFSNQQSSLSVVPIKFKTILSPDKAYILIGCLGGLGRSLSKWMFDRGARKFVFLGRSGADRGPARKLINELKVRGAETTVIRGDVSDAADVNAAVAQIQDSIGGVVHAAMGLDLALINELTSRGWRAGIDGKVQGAWNLHNALSNRSNDLDFFLMTSSIAGSLGTATESNYCAANAFLDAFARYRRRNGLPATALGLGMISEVGYLHEHPEIEALLLRKGVHPINEDELLQIVDIALSPDLVNTSARNSSDLPADYISEAQILTGLEALGLQKILAMGWERPTQVLDDPHTAIIAGGYTTLIEMAKNSGGEGKNQNKSNGNTDLLKPVSTALDVQISASTSKSDNDSNNNPQPSEGLIEAVQNVVSVKISALLLVPTEQLTTDKQLSDFGMDSMLAAEFRGAMFRTFRSDVPFTTLLDHRTSIRSLACLVGGQLLKKALSKT